jgi:hypothetical protein
MDCYEEREVFMALLVNFKRNRNGTWDVFGPASVVRPGAYVKVSKANGSTATVYVTSVSDGFYVMDELCVVGVIGKVQTRKADKAAAKEAVVAENLVGAGSEDEDDLERNAIKDEKWDDQVYAEQPWGF